MNNSCPSCGAVYTISAKDIGRRVTCKKCKTPLVIDESGIRLDGTSDAEVFVVPTGNTGTIPSFTPAEPAEPATEPKERNATEALQVRLGLIRDWPAVLFGVGLFLVIVFHLFPRIDQALIASRKAEVTAGIIEDSADERETTAKNNNKPTDAEKEARRKRSDDWQKEKQRLEERASLAEADAARALPWNYRGQLLGYVLLAFAGVGMLISDAPARRMVGGVLLLVLFITITHSGITISVGK